MVHLAPHLSTSERPDLNVMSHVGYTIKCGLQQSSAMIVGMGRVIAQLESNPRGVDPTVCLSLRREVEWSPGAVQEAILRVWFLVKSFREDHRCGPAHDRRVPHLSAEEVGGCPDGCNVNLRPTRELHDVIPYHGKKWSRKESIMPRIMGTRRARKGEGQTANVIWLMWGPEPTAGSQDAVKKGTRAMHQPRSYEERREGQRRKTWDDRREERTSPQNQQKQKMDEKGTHVKKDTEIELTLSRKPQDGYSAELDVRSFSGAGGMNLNCTAWG
ncbi:hypothetical protein C8R45DRAFT_927765 [Mycena sanguinolenta]|nr:hypothetical protein C8R45DRAFT_927765 [Mycena sanguinolenta]